MKKGWRSESARHSLAKKGIETGRKKQAEPMKFTLLGDIFYGLGEKLIGGSSKLGNKVGEKVFIEEPAHAWGKPVDFFSNLGENFIANAGKAGKDIGGRMFSIPSEKKEKADK